MERNAVRSDFVSVLPPHLLNAPRVEIAVPHPFRPNEKIRDSRPLLALDAAGPSREINLLRTCELFTLGLDREIFILHRGLALPANDHGDSRICLKVWIFPRRLHSVEDNLELWRNRDPHQRGLRLAARTNARYHG